MVLIGHNARIAWGISSMCGDAEDLFVETPGGPGSRVFHEPIRLKSGQSVPFDVVVTPHGPIVNDGFELQHLPPLALRWTALDPGRTLDALAGLDTAADWPPFRADLPLCQPPALQFVYAAT